MKHGHPPYVVPKTRTLFFLPFRFVLGEMPIMKNNFEGNQRTWRKTLTAMKHKKQGF
jgi:hypothetical protein